MDRRPCTRREGGILRRGSDGDGLRGAGSGLEGGHPWRPRELRDPLSRESRDGRNEDIGADDTGNGRRHTDERTLSLGASHEEDDEDHRGDGHDDERDRARDP